MMIDFKTAVLRLLQNDNFLILSHASPDGDTIGGSFALMLALKKLGKNAAVINNDAFPKQFDYITSLGKHRGFEEQFVLSVDVADAKLLGKNIEEKYADRIDLAIDHHKSNRLFAKESYVEGDSASVCEIIFNIIDALGVDIDKDIANCLYTGCSTDTGCFRYSNVTPRTHRIAASLIEKGADHSMINTVMFETKKKSCLELERLCLDSMELCFDSKVCIFVITKQMMQQTGCEESDFDCIVALSRQIEGVKIGVTLKEKDDGIFKVSVRSTGDIDASALCAKFGGGGHKNASGCSFDCGLEEAKNRLKEEIRKII
ncbi:MAG: bifunctional oligoribonuclease/PAP phosphatase NrnA [Acutalibacteraceae bacterium]